MKAWRILVPLDGSRVAETALHVALDLVRDAGGSLVPSRVGLDRPRGAGPPRRPPARLPPFAVQPCVALDL